MKRKQILKVRDKYQKLLDMLDEFVGDVDFYGVDLDSDEDALQSVNTQMTKIQKTCRTIGSISN